MRDWKAYLVAMSLVVMPVSAIAAPNEDGEEIPANEAAATEEVKRIVTARIEREAREQGHAYRDAHRKHHGCVSARFTVREDLPSRLKHGVLREAASYPAIVRYSNGSGKVEDDHDGDGRGMAVKLLGVAGERILNDPDEETSTQDFIMVNHPVFFLRSAADNVAFQNALDGYVMLWVFNPVRFFHEGLIGLAILLNKMTNPLDATYYSMVPSKLGPEQVKFRTRPCDGGSFDSSSDTANRLSENLAATLATKDACFQFQVQPRLDPARMPVEDPTIEWKEQDSPFQTVATITIPRQIPVKGEECETISYNPWNGLKEHRPLGGISRQRKEVYEAISKLRHRLNRQERLEPTVTAVR